MSKGDGVKLVIAVVKPFRATEMLQALAAIPFEAIVVAEAKGYGRQKDQLPRYLGSEYNAVYLPKIELRIYLPDEHLSEAVELITAHARTGRIGDGKLMVLEVTHYCEF